MSDSFLSRIRHLTRSGGADDSPNAKGIRLVVGLGNPGKEYAHNRHNVGYWTVNRLARRNGINLSTSRQTAVGEGIVAGRDVALAKPRTFVNKSGDAVRSLMNHLDLDGASKLLVVCDDLDMPTGKIRLRARGGSGGYKGLQSIIDSTGNDEFPRLRIGIGRPVVGGKPSWDPDVIGDYVLSDPSPSERDTLDDAVERAIQAIEAAIEDDIEQAMARFN